MSAIAKFTRSRWLFGGVLAAAIVLAFWISFGAALRQSALREAQIEAERRAGLEVGTLVADINKFRVLPFVLIELPDMRGALVSGESAARDHLNETLAALATQTGASAIYAIDRQGIARAASNASMPDSFVGYDFRFRPYFRRALADGADEYFAEGVVTSRAGLFLAHRAGSRAKPAGVIVVKIEFGGIEQLWRADGPLSLVVDRDGVILLSTDPRLRYRTLGSLPPQRLAEIRRTRQFGPAALRSAPLRLLPQGGAIGSDGQRYIATVQPLPVLGWRQVHLEPERPVVAAVQGRVRFATLVVALVLIAILALSFWTGTARRRRETARAELEYEVLRRTAELRQAYAQLQQEAIDRAQADSRYRAAREELAQANRLGSIGTITTSVAHELNQPVAAIRTAAENAAKLLARGDRETAANNLTLIVSLTQRIGRITGELLSYARRGRRGGSTAWLEDVLDGALLLIGDSFRRAGVTLEVVRAAELPRLGVEQIRLEQVLVNLLQNALDAVSKQSAGLVQIQVDVGADEARITVADNGPGVPTDLGDSIFQPFVTGKPHGNGLGLGICREIIQEYDGSLTSVDSTIGGAAFRIILPLRSRSKS